MKLRASNIVFAVFAAAVTVLVILQAIEGFGSAKPATKDATKSQVAATPPGAAAAGPSVAELSIESFAFPAETVVVSVGSTAKWTNNDGSKHTVTADDATFDSPKLIKGAVFEFTFTKAGTFTYHCAIHETMKGTITAQ